MGLIDRFQRMFRPREAATLPATVQRPPVRVAEISKLFAVERDRRTVVADSREMYRDDARPKRTINTLANDAVKDGFELRIEGARADEAEGVATELVERLNLASRLDDWGRLTLRDGDSFLEVGATQSGEIVTVSRKPALEMRRWTDEQDQFHDPMRAFYWTDQPWQSEPGPGAVMFAEWQMIHARWENDEGNRYGTPLYSSARKAYKRMSQGELDIAIRRKTRSGMRFWHIIEEGGQGQVEAYRTMNQAALDDPFAAVADFFSSGKTSIEQFQGDARLAEIDDILHHTDTFAVASPVPLELIGYGRNLNRDVLEQKKEQYDDSLSGYRQWLVTEILRPLLERQWLLKGIWPEGLDWSVEWKRKQAPAPVDVMELSRALAMLKATNLVTDETLLRLLAMVVPDFDVAAELAAVEKERPDEIARMGSMANGES